VLGFGAFHRFAPWTLLHELGPFRSQHVPMRWLYPALLLLGVATAAAFGRQLEQLRQRRSIEPLLLAGCLLLAVDIGRESSFPLQQAFWMRARPTPAASSFEQFERVPRHLQYQRRDYAPEAVPAMLAGSGVLQCNVHASLSIYAPKSENGRPFGMGARGRGASDYRGEAFTASGVGTARIAAFSPNRVVVELSGARVGDRLILNQNFDAGWRVDGRPIERYRDAIAAEITAPSARLTFRFWPRGLSAGLWSFGLTLAGVALLAWRRAAASTARP
ncbi:MAG TPA: hypothetical protein VEQ58_19385, partial [Polyangiaceae bacterium]|nr:hypothetical protein [Polyangiaceae bacterium]